MRYEFSLLTRLASLVIFLPSLFYMLFLPLTIWPAYAIFKLLNLSPIISSNIITINSQPLAFISACISPYAYYLLLALVMLTKDIKPITRLKMLLLGFSLILLANIIRVIILVMVLFNISISAFQALHIAFWLIVSTLYIALIWILLVKTFKIRSIPVYSDLKYLLEHSILKKKVLNKNR